MNEKIDAIISELGYQRMILGDRAAALAGELAATKKALDDAQKRVEELEKKEADQAESKCPRPAAAQ